MLYLERKERQPQLASLDERLSKAELERVLATLDQAPLLNVRAPEKHARRSAEQSVWESLLKETRKKRSLLALRTFKETFAGMRALAVELQLLGVGELSLALAKAWRITITSPTPTTILVNAPFTGTSLRAAKRIYGRVATYEKLSDGGKKFIGNAWPISQQAAVWQLLQNGVTAIEMS